MASTSSSARPPAFTPKRTPRGANMQTGTLDGVDSLASTLGPSASRATLKLSEPAFSFEFSDDHRYERSERGLVRYKPENDCPELGGMVWRTREGHQIKNQAYYHSLPNQNDWDNIKKAGPKTWRTYHGPRVRTNAAMMEHLDRTQAAQTEWETKKIFVNTVRVQSLDRQHHQRVENEQKERASQWAPHRRSRREIHKQFDSCTAELDAQPMKELKKVLTPHVLHRDREAIRMITQKHQTDETWKMVWKETEKQRRDDGKADFVHRQACTAMLMELSGQQHSPRDPNHKLPNNCTPRVEELAAPREVCLPGVLTDHTDFRGLYHADHRFALEARFPGVGHDFARAFCEAATDHAVPRWPPPPRLKTPRTDQARALPAAGELTLTRGSIPVTKACLESVAVREPRDVLSDTVTQFQATIAPPAPSQSSLLLRAPIMNDLRNMSRDFSPRADQTVGGYSQLSSSGFSEKSTVRVDLAPPQRPVVYPVLVPDVGATMERPGWKPVRVRSPHGGGNSGGASGAMSARLSNLRQRQLALLNPESARQWPPPGTQAIDITILCARSLPIGDRSGHSDPYVACVIPGKPKSLIKTSVIEDTETPKWNEDFTLYGWRPGDTLVFTVYDHDIAGQDDALGTIFLEEEDFNPSFEGTLTLTNSWDPGSQRLDREFSRRNSMLMPELDVKISVQPTIERRQSYLNNPNMAHCRPARIAMPDSTPQVGDVCQDFDDFERKDMVPAVGNFWRQGPPSRRQKATAAALEECVLETSATSCPARTDAALADGQVGTAEPLDVAKLSISADVESADGGGAPGIAADAPQT